VLLGGVGLGTTLAYFFGLYLAVIHGGNPAWSQFFLNWGSLLVFVPVMTLVGYIGVRSRVGAWLVERGAVETAARYAAGRLEPGLLRADEEAWRHHEALVRAEMARGDEEAARDVLMTQRCRALGEGRPAWLAWRLELVDSKGALETVESPGHSRVSIDLIEEVEADAGDEVAARLWAVAAEMMARDWLSPTGGTPTATQLVARARQRRESWFRIDIAEAIVLTLRSGDREDWSRAAQLLAEAFDEVTRWRPARRVELWALRAELSARLGQRQQAQALLEEARESDQATDTGIQERRRVQERYGLEG
jgi:hypothetical protein